MRILPKFPKKVWLSLIPVTLLMALVMAVVNRLSLYCFYINPDLPWWFDYVTMITAWSLMFGPYVVWITAEGIYYRQSLGME